MTVYESSLMVLGDGILRGIWERTLGEVNDELDGCQDPAGARRGRRVDRAAHAAAARVRGEHVARRLGDSGPHRVYVDPTPQPPKQAHGG